MGIKCGYCVDIGKKMVDNIIRRKKQFLCKKCNFFT